MLNDKKECIACGKTDLRNVLDLGVQAPANNLLNNQDDKDYQVFPLGIDACNSCGHGQLSYFVDPDYLFSNYYYVSSTSKTMKDHMDKLATFVLNLKGENASVLELGSNDGLFLKCLNEVGINNVLGVDPAENIVNEANEQGYKTILGFWPEAGDDLESFSYDMVIGQNVFAHTPNPLSALKEVKRVLKQDGYAIFQTSQADMVYNGEFDTTYHEHCSFFCEDSMAALAKRAGLKLAYTHYVDIHGGSSLYVLTQDYSSADKMSIELSAISAGLVEVEPASDIAGMLRASRTPEDWDNFFRLSILKSGFALTMSETWAEEGHRVVAVGAAAKAITFLRASDIALDGLLDEAPLKVGKWVPGLDVQISDFTDLQENDAYIIGAWNFAKEIAMKLVKNGANPDAPCMLYFPDGIITNLGYLAINGANFDD